jgi:hypothetical protein
MIFINQSTIILYFSICIFIATIAWTYKKIGFWATLLLCIVNPLIGIAALLMSDRVNAPVAPKKSAAPTRS